MLGREEVEDEHGGNWWCGGEKKAGEKRAGYRRKGVNGDSVGQGVSEKCFGR